MKRCKRFLLWVVLVVVPWPAAAQQPAESGSAALEQVIDRIVVREAELVKALREYQPLVETYLQDLRPDAERGMVVHRDYYFLGKADLRQGLVLLPMTEAKPGGWSRALLAPFRAIGGWFSADYEPGGFLRKIFVDTRGIGRDQYNYEFVRREFLGEIRCLVFDVTPVREGDGRFKGRIWVEDQDYTIVRFNGVRTPERTLTGFRFHFDSWRVNAAPGLWVPAYVYTAESELKDTLWMRVRFKAQTRLWGYSLKTKRQADEFSAIRVEIAAPMVDQSETSPDVSPIEAQRLWQREAELNVVHRLEKVGLVAPRGDVDKILETVVNNLQVTNNLDIQPEVQCRVLLTSTLESFSFGHTIVISRGLLDVLPDEASLAAVLAHELAHILIEPRVDADRWGFVDRLLFPSEEVFRRFSFASHTSDDKVAAKAVELLRNSPYKDKLHSAGLFLRQLQQRAQVQQRLVSPHLGNSVLINSELLAAAPQLEPNQLDQIAALPLGSRVKLNPWNNEVALLNARPVALISAREKMPLEVTPFRPYLTRYVARPADAVAAQSQQPSRSPQPPQPPQH
ncbi:MAG: M48 family metalloprotease [Acidobacteriia bacterium]|jgi:hypothetical protein|nr:M48 family metalloprotease [Terriglobia bacterium]